jgi:hypothetical protein
VGKKHIQVNEFIQSNFPQIFDFQNNIQIQIHEVSFNLDHLKFGSNLDQLNTDHWYSKILNGQLGLEFWNLMSKLWLREGLCKPGCTRLVLSACEIASYLIQGSPSLLHLLSHVGLQVCNLVSVFFLTKSSIFWQLSFIEIYIIVASYIHDSSDEEMIY